MNLKPMSLNQTKSEPSNKQQSPMQGYILFNSDDYKVGECYETNETPIVDEQGYNFFSKFSDCYTCCVFDENTKIAEVTAYGDIDVAGSRCCTNKIKINRELEWYEILNMVNIGKNCTGFKNTGNRNTGNHNSGNYNTGNLNHRNWNSGNYNSGDNNSGDYNSGGFNSGNYNSGYVNSGCNNSGSYNSGDHNSGSWNSGEYNIGDYNSGDCNISHYNSGCFNTKPAKMFFFNKLSDWTRKDWHCSEAKKILDEYVLVSPTKEIKKQDYIEELSKEDIFQQQQQNWNHLNQDEKEKVMAMPNFDKAIFKEVTGIDVDI